MVALSAATAAAIKDAPPAPRRVFVGVNLGMANSSARGNRVAASGRGAAISGEFGYLATPSLVAPYFSGGAAWGRGDAPEWEREGYPNSAWYMGLLAQQLTVGALYRRPVAGPRLHAYGGPAFLAVWQRHEVQDGLGPDRGLAVCAGCFSCRAECAHAVNIPRKIAELREVCA